MLASEGRLGQGHLGPHLHPGQHTSHSGHLASATFSWRAGRAQKKAGLKGLAGGSEDLGVLERSWGERVTRDGWLCGS